MENATIVRLRIKNFLGISDVEIKPGQINQIVGPNNQGKTSILRALGVAAEGSTDGGVVRRGAEAAEILVDLSDETVIRRRISAAGKQSTTVSRGQFEVKSPQAFLDALFDRAAFNPLDLLDPKKRNEAIMQAIPIVVTPDLLAEKIHMTRDEFPPMDYSQHGLKVIDALHRYLYQRRAEANKVAAEKAQRYDVKNSELPPVPAPPELSPDEARSRIEQLKFRKDQLAKRVDLIGDRAKRHEKLVSEIETKSMTVTALTKEEDSLDVEMEKRLAEVRSNFATRKSVIAGRKSELTQMMGELREEAAAITQEDPAPLLQENASCSVEIQRLEGVIKDSETVKAVQAQHQTVREIGQEADAAKAFADVLTAKVNLLAGPVKQEILGSVEMPIDGLTYLDGEFLLDGVRVENLSSSRALRLAIAIARKHAKKVKVICIDGAEALDAEAWATFVEETRGDGFTYFVTRVGEAFAAQNPGDKVLTMQNGEVRH